MGCAGTARAQHGVPQPDLNTFAERFVLSVRTKRPRRVIPLGEKHLRTILAEFLVHDYVQDREERTKIIHDIRWNGPVSKNVRVLAFFIRRSRDPFHRYLQILGPSDQWFLPSPPWERERVEVQDGVGWHQPKCPLEDFFEKEGTLELTGACGDTDMRVAELLPERVELRSEHAMGKGDGHDDSLYCRE